MYEEMQKNMFNFHINSKLQDKKKGGKKKVHL